MRIIVNNNSMEPIYEQVALQIQHYIIAGELKDGEALPSVRTMASELKISSLTVKKAYDYLEEEGFVSTVHGKGTFVNAADKQMAMEARRRAVEEDFSTAVSRAVSAGLTKEEIREILEIILED